MSKQFLQSEVVKLADVKVGDKLIADGGFTCIPAGTVLIVHADEEETLYVRCSGPDEDEGYAPTETRHTLDGQEANDGTLIGLRRVS